MLDSFEQPDTNTDQGSAPVIHAETAMVVRPPETPSTNDNVLSALSVLTRPDIVSNDVVQTNVQQLLHIMTTKSETEMMREQTEMKRVECLHAQAMQHQTLQFGLEQQKLNVHLEEKRLDLEIKAQELALKKQELEMKRLEVQMMDGESTSTRQHRRGGVVSKERRARGSTNKYADLPEHPPSELDVETVREVMHNLQVTFMVACVLVYDHLSYIIFKKFKRKWACKKDTCWKCEIQQSRDVCVDGLRGLIGGPLIKVDEHYVYVYFEMIYLLSSHLNLTGGQVSINAQDLPCVERLCGFIDMQSIPNYQDYFCTHSHITSKADNRVYYLDLRLFKHLVFVMNGPVVNISVENKAFQLAGPNSPYYKSFELTSSTKKRTTFDHIPSSSHDSCVATTRKLVEVQPKLTGEEHPSYWRRKWICLLPVGAVAPVNPHTKTREDLYKGFPDRNRNSDGIKTFGESTSARIRSYVHKGVNNFLVSFAHKCEQLQNTIDEDAQVILHNTQQVFPCLYEYTQTSRLPQSYALSVPAQEKGTGENGSSDRGDSFEDVAEEPEREHYDTESVIEEGVVASQSYSSPDEEDTVYNRENFPRKTAAKRPRLQYGGKTTASTKSAPSVNSTPRVMSAPRVKMSLSVKKLPGGKQAIQRKKSKS